MKEVLSLRAHRDAARVPPVPQVSFALAAVFACQGSDEEASTLMGPSDPIQVNLESITVDDPLYDALYTALQDEYQAEATYGSALEVYGELRPFTRIVRAEGRHVSAVARLIEKRGLPADVESVFLSLQNASELNRKAAFSRCM